MSKRFIGKCKGCKGCVRVEAVAARSALGRIVGRTLPNGQTVSTRALVGRDGRAVELFYASCLCGRAVEFRQVVGTVTAHKCSARCLASTSGVCECSCGGENHGASHAP